jgi:porin
MRIRRWIRWLLLAAPVVAACAAFGRDAPPAAPASPYDIDTGQETPRSPVTPPPLPEPSRRNGFLLGDWWGLQPIDDPAPFEFFVSSTQFEQGVASGGFRQGARWGSKFDMLGHLDTGRLGLWEGGTFDLFAETRLGQSVDKFAGVYSPSNLAMYFPKPDQQLTAITGLKFTQAITEKSGIYFGKLNALNGDRDRFLKYPLTSRFWNAAFNFNLALDRYPYSTPGAGFYYVPDRGPALSLLVLDSHNAPRTSGLENLASNGVFLYAEAKQPTEFFGLPGKQTFAGLYGSGSFSELTPASFIELPIFTQPQPMRTGTWTLLWNFEQALWVDADDPDRKVNLYVQTGLGDGNPNPVRRFLSASICGNSPFRGREADIWGIGVYDLGTSAAAQAAWPGLRDEYGVELFYNARIVPGCHVSPDVQILHPGLAPVDTALLFGVRMKFDF